MSTVSNVPPSVSQPVTPHKATIQSHPAKSPKEAGTTGTNPPHASIAVDQSTMTRFEQGMDGNPPFGMNSQANSDYQDLTLALQTGNLSAAQQAFANLQSDLKPESQSKKAHSGHHTHSANPNAGSTNSTTSAVIFHNLPATLPSANPNQATSTATPVPKPPATPAYLTPELLGQSDTEQDGEILNVTA